MLNSGTIKKVKATLELFLEYFDVLLSKVIYGIIVILYLVGQLGGIGSITEAKALAMMGVVYSLAKISRRIDRLRKSNKLNTESKDENQG
jgi:hypothetical protein